MENKNIDKLFQERLKNLEATPSKRVWTNIESDLKKKKKRVIPMWWFSTGIAAILILGFFIFPSTNGVIDDIDKQPIIIAIPEINTEKINAIKKEIPFNTKKEETLIVEQNKKSNKRKPLQKKNNTKITVLVADTKPSVIENKKKDTVSNSQKDSTFLKVNQINKTLESFKNKTDLASNSDAIEKDKRKKKNLLLAITNDIKVEEIIAKRIWSITPVVAVLNSNSFSNTSPIAKNLENSTEGDNSYSYGIKIGYQLNNKWTIQSGIHLQEIRFSNNQLAVVSTKSRTPNIAFNSGDNYSLEGVNSKKFNINNLSLNTIGLDGNLTQEYGYIEIPVEIKYNILESKKVKTQLVAGFSSLFLNSNSVRLSGKSFTETGKATNLNNLNFSGNLGMDFNYLFDKNWSFNINPMFKTQLNTYTQNANGFKPYFIGIYTGLNFKF